MDKKDRNYIVEKLQRKVIRIIKDIKWFLTGTIQTVKHNEEAIYQLKDIIKHGRSSENSR